MTIPFRSPCQGTTLRKSLILLFFMMIGTMTHAQTNNPVTVSLRTIKSRAYHASHNHEPYNAIGLYELYLRSGGRHSMKVNYALANLYFGVRDYHHALQYYDSIGSSPKLKYADALFNKGQVCMNLEQYEDAINAFTVFRNIYRNRKDPHGFRKLASVYISNASLAASNRKMDKTLVVTRPGVELNHVGIDMAPFPVNERTLLFAAATGEDAAAEHIFQSEFTNGTWDTPEKLPEAINIADQNTGNAIVNREGNEMYFTRTEQNWKKKEISVIFHSLLVNGTWQTPERLPWPVNDANYTNTRPAPARNPRNGNTVLYFVSDRKGGRGGLDIWFTELDAKTGHWGKPVNAGREINSPADEFSPFYDTDHRTLYFSSKGRPGGIGGYDIFKASGALKRWDHALPLPRPINSSYDDYYFIPLGNTGKGYFTSNRPGSLSLENGNCCDDIWMYAQSECAMVYVKGGVKNEMNHTLLNELEQKFHVEMKVSQEIPVLTGVTVEVYPEADSTNASGLPVSALTDQNGTYGFRLDKDKNYELLVKNYGFSEKRVPFNTLGLECNDTLDLGLTLLQYLPAVSLTVNIYYAHDKYRLTETSMQTINRTLLPLFDLFPAAVLEIGSHTDNTGTDGYNLKLSQRRAETVVSYLESKGIPAGRMVARGYGFRNPIAPNENPDGSDNPAGRELNRRTEIRIVGEILPETTIE